MPSQELLPEDVKKYFEAHPNVEAQLQRAERVYKIFGEYLNLTQSRVVIRESGGSNVEADLNGALSRANV